MSQSTRPYLMRAIYEWAMENSFTPQILVDAGLKHVNVPREFVKDGHIVFNIHDGAVQNLIMTNDGISFAARFSGRSHEVSIPIDAVLAIYARENNKGLFFQGDDLPNPPEPSTKSLADKTPAPQKKPTNKGPSHLKLIK